MVKTANQPRLKLEGAVVPLEQAVVPLLELPGVIVLRWQRYQGMGELLYRLGGWLYRFVGKIRKSGYGMNLGRNG